MKIFNIIGIQKFIATFQKTIATIQKFIATFQKTIATIQKFSNK